MILESRRISLAMVAELRVDEMHLIWGSPSGSHVNKSEENYRQRDWRTEQMPRKEQRCQEKVSVRSERDRDFERQRGRDQGREPKTMEPGASLLGSWKSPGFRPQESWKHHGAWPWVPGRSLESPHHPFYMSS